MKLITGQKTIVLGLIIGALILGFMIGHSFGSTESKTERIQSNGEKVRIAFENELIADAFDLLPILAETQESEEYKKTIYAVAKMQRLMLLDGNNPETRQAVLESIKDMIRAYTRTTYPPAKH